MFPTCSIDWDLELAFLNLSNFGNFAKYLTKSKEPSRGPNENCRSENAITQPIVEINTANILFDKIVNEKIQFFFKSDSES